jgi:hypothetical protein
MTYDFFGSQPRLPSRYFGCFTFSQFERAPADVGRGRVLRHVALPPAVHHLGPRRETILAQAPGGQDQRLPLQELF